MKTGEYKHFKGKSYEVISLAKHSETMEDMVIYKPLYESEIKCWVRPLSSFEESVLVNGEKIPRFKFIK
jgi:hypothetical protein